MVRSGAAVGLKPHEIWEMRLWEYNAYMLAQEEAGKRDTVNAIMTGYYAAYYTNGGRKAKNPNELIRRLYAKKQSLEDGLRDIERVKALDRKKE